MLSYLVIICITAKSNQHIVLPVMGLPPSDSGAFHFIVTDVASNLSITASRGSLGGSGTIRILLTRFKIYELHTAKTLNGLS